MIFYHRVFTLKIENAHKMKVSNYADMLTFKIFVSTFVSNYMYCKCFLNIYLTLTSCFSTSSKLNAMIR